MKRNNQHALHKASKKGNSSRSATKFVAPRTVEEFFRMSKQDQDLWNDVVQIVTEVGKGTPLAAASRRFGRNPRIVRQLTTRVFYKGKDGRYHANTRHPLLRVLVIPTSKGLKEIGVRKGSQASLLGEYWNALHRYLETGDDSALNEFRGKQITDSNGEQIELLTAPEELDRLASTGVLSFESIYARAA